MLSVPETFAVQNANLLYGLLCARISIIREERSGTTPCRFINCMEPNRVHGICTVRTRLMNRNNRNRLVNMSFVRNFLRKASIVIYKKILTLA